MAKDGDDYSGFDARYYVRTRFSTVNEWNGFVLQCYHDSYMKYHSHWDPENSWLLEFGGGPAIHPLISAAPFVSEIVFSDYAEDCRKQVQMWKDNDPDAHDWGPYFRHVVNKLEWQSSPEAVSVREYTLRDKIRAIIPCDIHAEHPVKGIELGTFDVVSTSACLEVAVRSPGEHMKALSGIRRLLKAGGLLISLTHLGVSWWKVQGETYHSCTLTEELVMTSLQQAGFTVLEHRFKNADTPKDTSGQVLSDYKSISFVVAKAT